MTLEDRTGGYVVVDKTKIFPLILIILDIGAEVI